NDGLLNNRITHLEIVNERIYVGHDKGISFQCAVDSFCTVSLPQDIPPKNITGILDFKNKIYVSTNGAGLFLLRDKQLIHVEGSPERIRDMVLSDTSIFLATRNGIFSFSEKEKFQLVPSTSESSYSSVFLYDNLLYGSTYDGELIKNEPENKQTKTIFLEEDNPFRNAFNDSQGNFWLNSKNGVVLIKNEEIIRFTESTGLPINDINIVFEDREKNIWFGSGGKGLLKFTGELLTHFNEKSGLPSDLIISVMRDDKENLWLSTYDKGVCKMMDDGTIITEDYIPSIVWNMTESKGLLFFGSNFGLHIYDHKQWRSLYVEDGLPSNRVTGLKRRRNGDIYIGTSEGTALYDINTHSLQKPFKNDASITSVRDFIEFNDQLYIAAQNEIYRIRDNNPQLIHRFDAGISCIEVDQKGNLWLGTENGLYIESKGILKSFTLESNGGAEYINFLRKIDSVLFVGTNNGLYEISLSNKNVRHYDINSGLVDLETNLNSSYLDEGRYLWFGTAAGLMKMDLEARETGIHQIPPKVHLTSIKINFEKMGGTRIQDLITSEKETLEIAYKNNNISFEFDGIYLTNPGGLKYSYYLEGFSETWSPTEENPIVNFTNLSPGEYNLLFKAITDNGVESDTFQIAFEILPPFYRTWWFYVLCFVFLAGLVILMDRLRVKRLERKNYRLKLEFENKLTRLEQHSLNASMNRHFIFNALNSIQYYINSSDTKSANKYLSRFAKLIRKNLDSSSHKNGMVSLRDELERLELYLELENMRFQGKFDYQIKIGRHVEVEMLRVPAMFLQPFVENSIIHGILPLKDRKGLITIKITDHLDHIRIEIKDNGVGIENSLKNKKVYPDNHESQGMLITKGRIELLQKISARSIEMIGPSQINENDSSLNGTVVIFKILKQYLE
ncbi:MAG: histidine kinase, partial [Brumimicrobium sp.]|nr:histidine kinase [Brumimicrobium sp.]